MPGSGEFLGKMILAAGFLLVIVGGTTIALSKVKMFGLGRLPGDIFIQKGNYSFYFPLVTCILLSVLLTVFFNLLFKR
ncbi:MAG TPA: DUF2905 domain-containing protein [Desulfotomaculum sp.]|nr:DUF2905 domain-containing protein [Desulfotomaculum sp.]